MTTEMVTTNGCERVETSPISAVIPVKGPTAAGAVFLDDLVGLDETEATKRKLRLFDQLDRDVFVMADMLGMDPVELTLDIKTMLNGKSLLSFTTRRRSGVTLQYVPSAHLQKLAGEMLTTVEAVHARLNATLADPEGPQINPSVMVDMMTKLLGKIIMIRGIVTQGEEENVNPDNAASKKALSGMISKMESLNKRLELATRIE